MISPRGDQARVRSFEQYPWRRRVLEAIMIKQTQNWFKSGLSLQSRFEPVLCLFDQNGFQYSPSPRVLFKGPDSGCIPVYMVLFTSDLCPIVHIAFLNCVLQFRSQLSLCLSYVCTLYTTAICTIKVLHYMYTAPLLNSFDLLFFILLNVCLEVFLI